MSPSGSGNGNENSADTTASSLGSGSAPISSNLNIGGLPNSAVPNPPKNELGEIPESVSWNQPDTKTEVIENIQNNQMVPQLPTSLPLDQVILKIIFYMI